MFPRLEMQQNTLAHDAQFDWIDPKHGIVRVENAKREQREDNSCVKREGQRRRGRGKEKIRWILPNGDGGTRNTVRGQTGGESLFTKNISFLLPLSASNLQRISRNTCEVDIKNYQTTKQTYTHLNRGEYNVQGRTKFEMATTATREDRAPCYHDTHMADVSVK